MRQIVPCCPQPFNQCPDCSRYAGLYTAAAVTTGKDSEWYLEIKEGGINERTDSTLNYVVDAKQRRVTFAAAGALWSLRFPTQEVYTAFVTELEVSRCQHTVVDGPSHVYVSRAADQSQALGSRPQARICSMTAFSRLLLSGAAAAADLQTAVPPPKGSVAKILL